MKKVAILLTSIPQSGGEHQYLMLLMEGLIKWDSKYFDVLAICCNRFWSRWCREHGVKFIYYKLESSSRTYMKFNAHFCFLSKLFNHFHLELENIISDNGIDLLVSGQQSIFIPRLSCKIMQPVHDLMHRYEPDFEEIGSTYTEREILFASSSRYVDVVLVDSQLGKKQYIECYYKKGRHLPRMAVLPYAAPDYRGKAEEKITVPAKYIFYPAQFWEHKNHRNLILAVNLLKEKIADVHLILVGSERNTLKNIRALIKENHLEKNVSIMGFVSDEQIIYLYKHAVALVMPTYIGPTNIPPLEAMALGCPVIVSNKYAMCEQVGSAGILCDPYSPEDIADCIETVWNNEKVRQDMIAKGYEQSRKWTVSDFKKRFLKIVLTALNR